MFSAKTILRSLQSLVHIINLSLKFNDFPPHYCICFSFASICMHFNWKFLETCSTLNSRIRLIDDILSNTFHLKVLIFSVSVYKEAGRRNCMIAASAIQVMRCEPLCFTEWAFVGELLLCNFPAFSQRCAQFLEWFYCVKYWRRFYKFYL